MPKQSKVKALPKGIREELDNWLLHKGFADYRELSQWLAGKGFAISKSALHRYGSAFEDKTEKLRDATQMAITLGKSVGDDEGAMNDALIRMTQGEIFDLLLKAEEQGQSIIDILPEISLAVSRLSRASLPQKKWQQELRKQVASASSKVKEIGRKGGLSDEALQQVDAILTGLQQ